MLTPTSRVSFRRTFLSVVAVAAATVIVSGVAVEAQVQSGAQEWGFSRSPESFDKAQAALERIRALEPYLTPLAADSRTDVVFPEMRFGIDASGGRLLKLRGQWSPRDETFFWTVDARTGTYRAFKITNANVDAGRIQAHLGASGNRIPLARIRERIAEAASRQQSRRAEYFKRAAARGDLVSPSVTFQAQWPGSAVLVPLPVARQGERSLGKTAQRALYMIR